MQQQMTATEALEQNGRDSDERALRHYVEHFIRAWAPPEPHAAAEFQADFLLVVQAIHRDASRPLQKALTVAFAAMPPIIFTKP